MKELGAYLKRTRVDNGVSIAEAAEDLELSVVELENIESGNTRAFKDVYNLKQYIKQYAKYLGLDPDKIVDEFNGFLFEHTSKISLDDIRAAQKKLDNNEKKVQSPYTKEYKEKVNILPFVVVGIVTVILFISIYIIISGINKAPTRIDELMPYSGEENAYEFTY